MDVGGEVGHQDSPGGCAEDALERGVQVALGARTAKPFRVRGVAEQELNALVAEAAEALHVCRISVGGRGVQLEVARVDETSGRRLDRERAGIWDRVADCYVL